MHTSPSLTDTLRIDVAHLAAEIGERRVGHGDTLQQAADWIARRLAASGRSVNRHAYEVDGVECENIELVLPGSSAADEIVVVGAHYDTVPGSPGADDNASGVAAVIALAEALAQAALPRTVRLVAFANEESPYAHTPQMGSWVYAAGCKERGEDVVAMLSLESIGYYCDDENSQQYPVKVSDDMPDAGDFIAFVGNAASTDLVSRAAEAFRAHSGFPCQANAFPEDVPGVNASDHTSFWREGYPALMVTDTVPFRNPNYHTPHDTPDTLDYARMAQVVMGLEHVVRDLAGA